MDTINERQWKAFCIDDIFEIDPGKRLTRAEMKPGKMPFIGASDSGNGITAFVSNENRTMDSNVLGVNYNGSVAESFYHPYKCIFSDDVKRFRLKDREGDKYIYLFLKTLISMQKGKYQYGYKFNENRMRRQKILIPVDASGRPDYDYMQSAMRGLEEKLLNRYRAFMK